MWDYIGFLSPLILIIMNIYFLLPNRVYLFGYVAVMFANYYLNIGVKNIIQEARPDNQVPFISLDTTEHDVYGMPSGHAQSVFYSSTFLLLTSFSYALLVVSFVICTCTIFQRYLYRRHTLEQLGIGAIVGTCIGYITFVCLEKMDKTSDSNKVANTDVNKVE